MKSVQELCNYKENQMTGKKLTKCTKTKHIIAVKNNPGVKLSCMFTAEHKYIDDKNLLQAATTTAI